MKILAIHLLMLTVAGWMFTQTHVSKPELKSVDPMRLGNFSVSLSVKDIQASFEFYQKLGFEQVGGDLKQRWVVLRNQDAKIGLFQGMFEKNTLTFNPGWDSDKKTLEDFDDVRDLQKKLVALKIVLAAKADEATDGPAFIAFEDPDGNPILIDQHVAKPKK